MLSHPKTIHRISKSIVIFVKFKEPCREDFHTYF